MTQHKDMKEFDSDKMEIYLQECFGEVGINPASTAYDIGDITDLNFDAFQYLDSIIETDKVKAQTKAPTMTSSLPESNLPPKKLFLIPIMNHKKNKNLCKEKCINPSRFRFEPREEWKNCNLTLDALKNAYFPRKLGKKTLFQHKLWNALQITVNRSDFYPEVGVQWITPNIFKMNLNIFGSLLHLAKPKQSLYAKRGSMMTHGFVEILKDDAVKNFGVKPDAISDVDGITVKMFCHKKNEYGLHFVPNFEACRWIKYRE